MTRERLQLPLHAAWTFQTLYAPQPAWPEPAKTDYWHRKPDLKARVTYDNAFHPIVADGAVFFASSADDRVYALDAASGTIKWDFAADAPVRLAPAWHDGKLYFASDDGKAYCLQAETGQLLWKWQRAEPLRLIPGNERIISNRPIRTGLVVEKDHLQFLTGLFPDEGVELYDLNPADGAVRWVRKNLDVSPQGYLLASKNKLYVPTGRTAPVIFDRNDGRLVGRLSDAGGTFTLLHDDLLIHGPGDLGKLDVNKKISKDPMVTYNGLQVIISGPISFLRSDSQITAVYRNQFHDLYRDHKKLRQEREKLSEHIWDLREKRKMRPGHDAAKLDQEIEKAIDRLAELDDLLAQKQSSGIKWQMPIDESYAMILAHDVLYIGGDQTLTAISAIDGRKLWQGNIRGKGYGLAVANGMLVVSTDLGIVHCFKTAAVPQPAFIQQQKPAAAEAVQSDYTAAAARILRETGIKKGYCLVLGSGKGKLALALARQSDLTVVGIDDNLDDMASSREMLHKTGLYGKRISIYPGKLNALPFTDYMANLIVSERAMEQGELPTPPQEVLRVLRPFGGQVCLGFNSGAKAWLAQAGTTGWQTQQDQYEWVRFTRGELAGSGEWTHLYADAANTSCSKDELTGPMQIQWFGRPGPREIINRHSRPMSPLFKSGRVFVPADNKVMAVDAYNGTPLWSLDVPQSRRLGALKDCGQMVVTDDELYVAAQQECWQIDVNSGRVIGKHKAPQLIAGERREWGYVASVGEQLFGSGKKPGASFYELARLNCDELEGDFREMICSDYLFAMDRHSGRIQWSYRNGVLFNNTIAIGDDYVYLVESRNDKALGDLDGRLRVDYFCEGESYIVKLNRQTGAKVWEKPFHFPYQQIMYLSYTPEQLLVVGSYNVGSNVHYSLYAFRAADGEKKWENSYKGDRIGGEHGEQWQHPVIIGDVVYQRPYSFDLHTGRQGNYELHRGGGGCGGLSGSANYLFGRGSNPRMYELKEGETSGTPLTRVNRPGCWINIVAAGGLIMIPESSSGCTCAYPVQTSFVFVPGS